MNNNTLCLIRHREWSSHRDLRGDRTSLDGFDGGVCGADVFAIMYLVLFKTIQAKFIKMLLVQYNGARTHDCH